jgi:hypothetical protein
MFTSYLIVIKQGNVDGITQPIETYNKKCDKMKLNLLNQYPEQIREMLREDIEKLEIAVGAKKPTE